MHPAPEFTHARGENYYKAVSRIFEIAAPQKPAIHKRFHELIKACPRETIGLSLYRTCQSGNFDPPLHHDHFWFRSDDTEIKAIFSEQISAFQTSIFAKHAVLGSPKWTTPLRELIENLPAETLCDFLRRKPEGGALQEHLQIIIERIAVRVPADTRLLELLARLATPEILNVIISRQDSSHKESIYAFTLALTRHWPMPRILRLLILRNEAALNCAITHATLHRNACQIESSYIPDSEELIAKSYANAHSDFTAEDLQLARAYKRNSDITALRRNIRAREAEKFVIYILAKENNTDICDTNLAHSKDRNDLRFSTHDLEYTDVNGSCHLIDVKSGIRWRPGSLASIFEKGKDNPNPVIKLAAVVAPEPDSNRKPSARQKMQFLGFLSTDEKNRIEKLGKHFERECQVATVSDDMFRFGQWFQEWLFDFSSGGFAIDLTAFDKALANLLPWEPESTTWKLLAGGGCEKPENEFGILGQTIAEALTIVSDTRLRMPELIITTLIATIRCKRKGYSIGNALATLDLVGSAWGVNWKRMDPATRNLQTVPTEEVRLDGRPIYSAITHPSVSIWSDDPGCILEVWFLTLSRLAGCGGIDWTKLAKVEFSAQRIIRGRFDDGKWMTLIAYCKGCGSFPLVADGRNWCEKCGGIKCTVRECGKCLCS